MLVALNDALCSSVLHFFKGLNQKIGSRLTVWYMREETAEHTKILVKVFKWTVLPASGLYVWACLFYLARNTLSSILLGILVFFYSSFVPDLPAMCRRKKGNGIEDLTGYRKYALLLFAPLLVWLLFSGIRVDRKTTENFHNFRSLAIYVVFLLLCGFLVFGDFPISVGDVFEILPLPFYGLIGYLIHLKVDRVW